MTARTPGPRCSSTIGRRPSCSRCYAGLERYPADGSATAARAFCKETWAKDIAIIAERHTTRIAALLAEPSTGVQAQFDAFLTGLRGNLRQHQP